MVIVQLGGIQTGGWSDNAGIFTGQNIQNSWDAHSVEASAFSGSMGDFCLDICLFGLLENLSWNGQPTYDQDVKGNHISISMA